MSNQKNQLGEMVTQKEKDLWSIKAAYLSEGKEIYFKRALINIMDNKDLAEMSKTPAGAGALFKCISQALQMGLQIGGQIPQAYILPFKNQPVLSPTAEGYKFIVLSDPPVLKDFHVQKIHDGDDCSINAATGEVTHTIPITKEKRNLIGIYCVITELNGRKHADFMSRGDIEDIRDKWSLQKDGKAWTKSFDQMALAKAVKRFLKPYAAKKEGLAMALTVDEDSTVQDNRPISDRVMSSLDNVIDADIIPDEEPVKKDEPEKDNIENNESENRKTKLPF